MTMFTFCLHVNIEIKTVGWYIQKSGVVLKTNFVVSMDSSEGIVAARRKSMLSTLRRFESHQCFLFLFSLIFSYVSWNHLFNSFNFKTKCPLNDTLANTKTNM